MKNRFFTILIIIVGLSLISTASICNACETLGSLIKNAEDLIISETFIATIQDDSPQDTSEGETSSASEPELPESSGEPDPVIEEDEDSAEIFEFILPEKEILRADRGISGYIVEGGSAVTCADYDYIVVGDNHVNQVLRGYISFNISGLWIKDIRRVRTASETFGLTGNLSGFSSLDIKACNYGNSLETADFAVDGIQIISFPASSSLSLSLSNEAMLETFMNAIEGRQNYYQLQLEFSPHTNNNSQPDGFNIKTDSIYLEVEYY